MLAVISPAKKLNLESEPGIDTFTLPAFLDQTQVLVKRARRLSRAELQRTMKLSDALADLNFQRFRAFDTPFTPDNAKPAALTFNGDTYAGLDAPTLGAADMDYAQDHLRILSGLYGLLRPLDLIQPYRLEMGARFQPPRGADLYDFWGRRLTEAVNRATEDHADRTLVNLASNEYFKAIDAGKLAGPVITPVFKEVKSGQARVLGMFAKRARGAMARYIIERRIDRPDGLKDFSADGYGFRADLSDADSWVFTRAQPKKAAA